MNKSTYLLIGIMLAAVIIPYAYFLNWSMETYRACVDDMLAYYESKIPGASAYTSVPPYWRMWHGQVAIVAGILILVIILVTIGIIIMSSNKDTNIQHWS